jgi:hypothetical protein
MTKLVEVSIDTPSEELRGRSESALASAKSFQITVPSEYEAATEALFEVKSRWRRIDEIRKSLVKPIDEARKRVQDFFRLPMEHLEEAEVVLKRKLGAYQEEQERARREAQHVADELARKERERLERQAAKAEAKGDHEKAARIESVAQQVVAPIVESEVPKVAGLTTREVWKFVVRDPELLPRRYLMVNEAEIRKVVNAMKGETSIPGVHVYPDKSQAARA